MQVFSETSISERKQIMGALYKIGYVEKVFLKKST